MPPIHQQGSLDGLCGIYSIINSMSLQLGERFDCAHAFSVLLRGLGSSIHAVTTRGMTTRQLTRMLEDCGRYLNKRRIDMRFRAAFLAPPASLGAYWRCLAAHHDAHGAGSIVVGMIGEHDHWSCIQAVKDDGLAFADSHALTWLPRRRVTIAVAHPARPHQLIPSQTFLIEISK